MHNTAPAEPAGTEFNRWNDAEQLRCEIDDPRVEKSTLEWRGGYFGNNFQIVTEEDSVALADALDRALISHPVDPEADEVVREFAAFCRAGEFCIG